MIYYTFNIIVCQVNLVIFLKMIELKKEMGVVE